MNSFEKLLLRQNYIQRGNILQTLTKKIKSYIIHGTDISISVLVYLPSSTIATSSTSIVWAFSCGITGSISVYSVNKLSKLPSWKCVYPTLLNLSIWIYSYPEMPVVPLCDVHPAFGNVTTLNREKTKK